MESRVALSIEGAVGAGVAILTGAADVEIRAEDDSGNTALAGVGFTVLASKKLLDAGGAEIEFMAGAIPFLAGGLWLAPPSAYLGIGIGDVDTKGAETVATVAEGGR